MRSRFVFVTAAFVLALASSWGCSDTNESPAPVCFDAGIEPSCTPAYEPSWDALYANTFKEGCAFSGVSCHASTGRQGGVDFADSDTAYADLMKGKVVAGKPDCSPLVHRVIATDGRTRMPPARSLSAGEQCAIVQWISAGANR